MQINAVLKIKENKQMVLLLDPVQGKTQFETESFDLFLKEALREGLTIERKQITCVGYDPCSQKEDKADLIAVIEMSVNRRPPNGHFCPSDEIITQ